MCCWSITEMASLIGRESFMSPPGYVKMLDFNTKIAKRMEITWFEAGKLHHSLQAW